MIHDMHDMDARPSLEHIKQTIQTLDEETAAFNYPKESHVPMFTAKHYIEIADVIYNMRKKTKERDSAATLIEAQLETVNQLTLAFCKLLREDNPKFKEFQFIAACNRDLDQE